MIRREYTWWDEVLDGTIGGLAVCVVLAIAFALIMGCAPPPPPREHLKDFTNPSLPPIRVYTNATGPGLVAVERGVYGWARVTRGVREWEIVPSMRANVLVLEVPASSGMCSRHVAGCTYGVGGLWTHSNGADPQRVFVHTGQYENAGGLVVMHELGHKLGLAHAEPGIMGSPVDFGQWGSATCPDPWTVARAGAIVGERFEACDE